MNFFVILYMHECCEKNETVLSSENEFVCFGAFKCCFFDGSLNRERSYLGGGGGLELRKEAR